MDQLIATQKKSRHLKTKSACSQLCVIRRCFCHELFGLLLRSGFSINLGTEYSPTTECLLHRRFTSLCVSCNSCGTMRWCFHVLRHVLGAAVLRHTCLRALLMRLPEVTSLTAFNANVISSHQSPDWSPPCCCCRLAVFLFS